MIRAVVLDAAAFDVLDTADGQGLRGFLRQAVRGGGEIRVAAVTVGEVARGTARTRAVESALARRHEGRRIEVVPTDLPLAKAVGRLLHAGGLGSEHLGDAHVVAVAAAFETVFVITSDADDIRALAEAVPATRVLTRRPDQLIGV